MGCKQSTPKGDQPSQSSTKQPPQPVASRQKKNVPAELFVRSVLEDADQFFGSLPDPESLRVAQGTVFLNSVAEVLRITFRMKIAPTIELLRSVFDNGMPILTASLTSVEDHSMDDGFMRLLNSWELQNPEHKSPVSGKVIQAVLRSVEVHTVNVPAGGFGTILRMFTDCYYANQPVRDLFSVYSSNGSTLSKSEYLTYLRAAQGQQNMGERAVYEKIRSRFGGIVTKYNFCSYVGGIITNSALDPQCASNVWQDMTQPLPHYLVSTAHVNSETELLKAIRENVRTFVLTCCMKEGGDIYTGSCKLSQVLDSIKQSGFKDSSYPIILCFNPNHPLDHSLQESIATLIKAKLGSMLARGVMFEGAMINDPNFSPAALQRKVLLMGNQAPLKPFVGFHVADMNREGLGVRVTDVQSSTPASKAGIAKDDWLTHINGAQIRNKKHLREQLETFQLGDEFTMKKENLDEVHIVVGGAVSSGDAVASQALSDLIFLKFVLPEAPDSPREHYFPWESSATTSETLSMSLTPNKRDLKDRFLFVSQPPASSACGADAFVGAATSRGAQFVDAGGRVDTHIWARGLFTNNAHCGYLLKSNDVDGAQPSADVTLKIISGPTKVSNRPPKKVSVRMHGAGRVIQQDELTFTFCECEDSTVAIVEMEYVTGDEGLPIMYVSSFPPLLLRVGYRVLPALDLAEELQPSPTMQGIFCSISSLREFSGTYTTDS